ncbi:ATP-dependent helicase [Candidatus Saccharibacteria bacterium]|nr:ATP-dependent helicase [Candidatus Saccharibacteria bacterium]
MRNLGGLNEAQKAAVEHGTGPALVAAGAGTGKTAVLTFRIANLILKQKIPQSQILALTFTDKAATEMQERVDRLLPHGYVESDISTFHALGDKILRAHSLELGITSDFVVMSNFSQGIFLSEVIENLAGKLKNYRPLGNPKRFVSAAARFISRLKDEAITAEQFAEFVSDQIKTEDDLAERRRLKELSLIYKTYQAESRRRGLIDYGDQVLLVLELFKSRASVLKTYQQKFRFILVDEFQDTNFAQFELVKLLSAAHRNLMVVGDDDQSIYRFRGAAITNILSFVEHYPDAKRIVLTNNYRSGQKILDAAYRLIQHNNPYRLEKQQKVSKKLLGSRQGQLPRAKIFDTQVEEAEYVAAELKKLHKNGYRYKDMAILIRKNSQSCNLAHCLNRHLIPYVLSESTNLLEQPEVKVLLHFINSLNDPGNSQALYGLLTSEVYNIALSQLVAASAQAARTRLPLEQYLTENKPAAKQINSIIETINYYRGLAHQMSGGELLYDFLQHSGYLVRLTKQALTDNSAVRQIQNITQLFELIRDFETVSYDPNIVSLWSHLAELQQSTDDIVVQASPLDLDAVRILTVHRAKGLEFRVVLIVDAVEATFPAVNRAELIRMPKGLFDSQDGAIDWHIMDERRLFYVAMTRAKEYLRLSAAYNHGGKRLKRPSRFITEALGEVVVTKKRPVILKSTADSLINYSRLPESKFDPLARFYSDGWLQLSTNQVADYLRSPKEFWYFHVLSLPKGPFHALVYGTAIHAAIERYFRAKLAHQNIGLKDLYETFEASWLQEGFVSLQHQIDRFNQGKNTLKHFYANQQRQKSCPAMVEQPFLLRLPEIKVAVSGRYDAVYKNNDKIDIYDFKTSDVGSKKDAEKRLRESIQMAIYALAWEKNHRQVVNTIGLQFVERQIIAKLPPPAAETTISKLTMVCNGIKNREFSKVGQSQINFEKLV